MFTLDHIREAHSKVKSGADFPQYVQNLINLGVLRYDIFVRDGHGEYFGKDNFHIRSEAKYPAMETAEKSDLESFLNSLKSHQRGETDYLTFCKNSAESGIEKWTVDMSKMTCTYYDKRGEKILTEDIPIA